MTNDKDAFSAAAVSGFNHKLRASFNDFDKIPCWLYANIRVL